MTTTPNLHLPQFEATDRIMHGDFNDAMAKIDAAVAGGAKIVTGTFIGDGAATRMIALPFTPTVIMLWCRGYWQYYDGAFGGIAIAGSPVQGNALVIADGGFSVAQGGASHTNENGTPYIYLAIQ